MTIYTKLFTPSAAASPVSGFSCPNRNFSYSNGEKIALERISGTHVWPQRHHVQSSVAAVWEKTAPLWNPV